MCGIAGFLDFGGGLDSDERSPVLHAMTDQLVHRGPDSSGTWMDSDGICCLGHRRLSIIDISELGHQPMISAGSRYVITFNGEVYNYRELRKAQESRGMKFRGDSDTEVLLNEIESVGLRNALRRVVGMFAIALWDRKDRRLYLARDRMGEKPLYYGRVGSNGFVFASELKAILRHPAVDAAIDESVVPLYCRYSYVPAPWSIYRGIYKLLPGSILEVGESELLGNRTLIPSGRDRGDWAPESYWDPEESGVGVPSADAGENVERLDALLRRTIRSQIVADVPVGAMLSGGIDSSAVVSIMQQVSPSPVRTFSIGFSEASFNEARCARDVASHLGTDHTELYVTPREAMDVIPQLPCIYDEPFADSSQIPTYLVSSLARQQVKVALTGDGADELFGGYVRYHWAREVWRRTRRVPGPMRRALAMAMERVSPEAWDRLFGLAGGVLPPTMRQSRPGDKLHKLASILRYRNPEHLYLLLVSQWTDPPVPGRLRDRSDASGGDGILGSRAGVSTNRGYPESMMRWDMQGYLPDDILVKLDRASMAVSLESRAPFLDHRIVEFANELPLDLKIRRGRSKWLLRQVLARYVPETMTERPKMGFSIPIGEWLRGPLKDWAEEHLSEAALNNSGLLDPAPIRRTWLEHLSGRRNFEYRLWNILMFQSWHRSG